MSTPRPTSSSSSPMPPATGTASANPPVHRPWVNAALQVADALASWSWWKFMGVSLLILIAGGMLDDYLVPPVRQPVAAKSVSATEGDDPGTDRVAINVGSGGSVVIQAESASGASEPARKIKIDIGDRGVHIDGLDPEDRDALQKAFAGFGRHFSSSHAGDDTQVQAAVADASWGAGMGWREEPFVGLAKLLVVSLLILKVIGSSKRRELRAQAAAAAAEQGRESARLEQELAEARLRQMQTQIEPHFLFNTLAALQQLIANQPDKAAEMNRHLIDWLRSGLQQMRQDHSTLAEEAQLLGDYLHIMKVRMEGRLQWQIRFAPELLGAQIPSLMLQPLVENAIAHGLEPRAAGGSIDIHAERIGQRLQVVVEDDGVGFQSSAMQRPGQGLGLDSVRSRLKLRYGDTASLHITARDGGGTRITLSLPWPA